MHIFKHIEREEGQGLVEYALLLVLVAVIVIAILAILGSAVTLVFARVVGGLNGDVVENNGGVFLSGESTATGSGFCTGQLSDVQFAAVDGSGSIITEGSVTRRIYVNGSPGPQITGSVSGNGVATAAGPYTVTGTCPLKFTVVP